VFSGYHKNWRGYYIHGTNTVTIYITITFIVRTHVLSGDTATVEESYNYFCRAVGRLSCQGKPQESICRYQKISNVRKVISIYLLSLLSNLWHIHAYGVSSLFASLYTFRYLFTLSDVEKKLGIIDYIKRYQKVVTTLKVGCSCLLISLLTLWYLCEQVLCFLFATLSTLWKLFL
jgi:hypothetical protein